MSFNTGTGPITIAPAVPPKQKFFRFSKPPASAPLSSPSSSSSSSSSMNSFLSNMRKVPRTLKNILTRTSTSPDGTTKPKKRSKLKPIDLFEPQSLSVSEGDAAAAYGYLSAAAQQKQKKYSTNVDTKEYNLPVGSDRKRSSAHATTTTNTAKEATASNNPETLPQVITLTTNDEAPKSTAEMTKTATVTTLESSDVTTKNAETPIPVTPKTDFDEPLRPKITRNKHSSYFDELVAENDIDNLSIRSSSSTQSVENEDCLTPGERRWKLQRKAWLKPRPEVAEPPRDSVIKPMSEAERIAVYKYLVVSNRRLREPMPLADLLTVLRSGWIATGQCPVFEIPIGTI